MYINCGHVHVNVNPAVPLTPSMKVNILEPRGALLVEKLKETDFAGILKLLVAWLHADLMASKLSLA